MLLKVRQHKKLYEVKCDTRITSKGRGQGRGIIRIRFKYFLPLVEEIKASLEGAKWNAEETSWDIPITERNEYVLSYLQNPKKPDFPELRTHKFEESLATLPSPDKVGKGLFNHQQTIYNFILSRRRCLIAADPGTGKTLPTLLVIEKILGTVPSGSGQAVIVAPRSAQNEWRRQIERFGFHHLPASGSLIFTTYESLHKLITTRKVLGHEVQRSIETPDILIFDESVKIKSEKAARSQSAFELAARVRGINGFIVLLSGAPAPKNPGDWWHQIECLQPGYIRECSAKSVCYRLGEWDFTGEYPEFLSWKLDEIERFSKYISPYVLVIRKKDVFDLPEKIYESIRIPVDTDTRRTALALAYNYDLTGGRSITLLHKLRELSDGFLIGLNKELISIPNSPKERVVEDFLDFYEQHGRIVIFGGFIESINKIKALCERKNWLTETSRGGHTFPKDFLDEFDSDSDNRLAAVAYPGCVYGLNLSRTLALIYYSNTFNADDRLQSIERRDRPGMDTSRGTRVIDLIHLESDEKVMDNIVNKIGIHNLTLEEIQKCLKE